MSLHHAATPRTKRGSHLGLLGLIALGSLLAHAQDAPAPAEESLTPLESELWLSIERLRAAPPTTQPYEGWFDAAVQRHTALLDLLRSYQTLYPGGRHREAVIRLELNTRFEQATLRNESLTSLSRRCADLLADPATPAIEYEAAYWQMMTDYAAEDDPAALSTAPVPQPPAKLLKAYRQYVDRYPQSPYVPRLASVLFEQALARDDPDAIAALERLLAKHFSGRHTTTRIRARAALERNIGRPFNLSLEDAQGGAIQLETLRGRCVLIVLWASFDARAVKCVRAVEEFRSQYDDVAVIGVNIDPDLARLRAATEDLGIAWPQAHDGLGWGTALLRKWGLRRIPRVLVVDGRGVLRGIGDAESWRRLAQPAVSDE